MQNIEKVIETINQLKKRIIKAEQEKMELSEADTRQGLINSLFRTLGWDFGDFETVKSEIRHKPFNEPVDYAFYTSESKTKPILLLEAKRLGSDLNNPKTVKQICTYLGEMGVQWGVLSDGNKYIMYNSMGGKAFGDQRFLTLQLKTVDTEDGIPAEELAKKLLALLGRDNLENKKIQTNWEHHMINTQIENALISLLSEPFATLATAIRREFKEDRVHTNPNLKVTAKHIETYLDSISDEEGKIPVDLETFDIHSDEKILSSLANPQSGDEVQIYDESSSDKKTGEETKRGTRVTINNLLADGLVQEGDNWKLEYKGEVFWGRVTGNGQLEVNGKDYSNPSRAGTAITKKSCSGWYWWLFKESDDTWRRTDKLRQTYRDKYGLAAITWKDKSERKSA